MKIFKRRFAHTIFDSKDTVAPSTVAEKRNICRVHKELANLIFASDLDEDCKYDVLLLIDEAFDMGKRMGAKLDEYHKNFGVDKRY